MQGIRWALIDIILHCLTHTTDRPIDDVEESNDEDDCDEDSNYDMDDDGMFLDDYDSDYDESDEDMDDN